MQQPQRLDARPRGPPGADGRGGGQGAKPESAGAGDPGRGGHGPRRPVILGALSPHGSSRSEMRTLLPGPFLGQAECGESAREGEILHL